MEYIQMALKCLNLDTIWLFGQILCQKRYLRPLTAIVKICLRCGTAHTIILCACTGFSLCFTNFRSWPLKACISSLKWSPCFLKQGIHKLTDFTILAYTLGYDPTRGGISVRRSPAFKNMMQFYKMFWPSIVMVITRFCYCSWIVL